MFHHHRHIYSIFLLITTLFSGWLIFHAHRAPKHPPQITAEKPNIIVNNVVATRFDNTGLLNSKLYTPQLIHYKTDNLAILINPKLFLYSAKEKPWVITAKTANTTDKLEIVTLKEQVKLFQPAGPNNPEITITTEELILYPKENRAETNKLVTIYEKSTDNSVSIVKSLGAKVNQKTGVIELQSQARGYYAPNT